MKSNNFLKKIINSNLFSKKFINRLDNKGKILPKIITRFPPEPNGYLHIGHAKSIFINFGLAKLYKGKCNLRFDDTNPEKEKKEYILDIINSIKWLGFNLKYKKKKNIFYASDYFKKIYNITKKLILFNKAYIDEQNIKEIQKTRGTLIKKGINSPWRNRPIEESLNLFKKMRKGKYKNGSLCVRAKIDMLNSNINLRDPVIYRIRHIYHYKTKNKWCIYPTYIYAHPIEDALEYITHSFCTLEFADQRPFYNWVLKNLYKLKIFKKPLPKQYEFSRLNLTHTLTSKRKLKQLIKQNIVSGWDDPRLPTISGLRRRGYTPKSIKILCEKIGITKNNSFIEYKILENSLREDLEHKVPRIMVVLKPIKLIIDNLEKDKIINCIAPSYPKNHILYKKKYRKFLLTKNIWIEKEDFSENPSKDFFRLSLGNKVRLKYSYIIKCTKIDKDNNNNILAIHCIYYPNSNINNLNKNKYKVKSNIHWVSKKFAIKIEVRLFNHLFKNPKPNLNDKINKNSIEILKSYSEITLKKTKFKKIFQFERQGYFIYDKINHTIENPVFNRIVPLKNNIFK
ncbi:glutamine--tRNA ligase/YqeY domain fusion protein [Candidatus Zinderia endosymbiont of Aphrophora alni]|uniref:glutamine--tRNA ligase/YqeY domain fusion protein n=1 Tax=Candidatus Zinderia endosymbiont of Aphrophora alni TaxID=3077951 RepID=UPI0030CEF9E2